MVKKSVAIYGDNDPYVPQPILQDFANLTDSEILVIKDGGHLNESASFIEFLELRDIVLNI